MATDRISRKREQVRVTKGGISYRRQQFKNRNGEHFSTFELPAKQMDDYVWQKIMEAMKHPEAFITSYLTKELADPKQVEQLEHQLNSLREQKANTRTVEMARIETAYERGIYDEDQLQQKLTLKQQEITEIESRIIALEDQMAILGNTSQEIDKLKSSASEIKYKIDHLTPEQKHILCQLFVDRIEMTRTKPKGQRRWQVNAEIHFRFNPRKLPAEMKGIGTLKRLDRADNGDLCPENEVTGQKGGSSYTLFTFKLKLISDLSKVILEEIS